MFLTNLKIFKIKRSRVLDENLTFNLPSLQKLKIDGFNLKLKDANLNYLESRCFSDCTHFIGSAINLEHLYCDEIKLENLRPNLLQKLNKLKSISFNQNENTFYELKRQKEQFNKNLKIYFLCIESNATPSFAYLRYLNDELLEYCINNYDRIVDICPFIELLDFNDLESCCIK